VHTHTYTKKQTHDTSFFFSLLPPSLTERECCFCIDFLLLLLLIVVVVVVVGRGARRAALAYPPILSCLAPAFLSPARQALRGNARVSSWLFVGAGRGRSVGCEFVAGGAAGGVSN
jgi:hypothetical protein